MDGGKFPPPAFPLCIITLMFLSLVPFQTIFKFPGKHASDSPSGTSVFSARTFLKPRLHDTTYCQTRCQTGCTTRFDNRLYRVNGVQVRPTSIPISKSANPGSDTELYSSIFLYALVW